LAGWGAVRICLVYDCLFPYTVGGAERWYRELALKLAAEGHAITYLTRRQWPRGQRPDLPGAEVVAVAPAMELYAAEGQRRTLPPIAFGAGVLVHLARSGRRYDVVHTASFPYFSLLAAGLARRRSGYRLVVDWHELWTPTYWEEYLGRAGGRVGWGVQQLCTQVPQRAFCFAHLTAGRLREAGVRGPVSVLEGEFTGPLEPRGPEPAELFLVFAGRHIPEKRAGAIVPALALARERIPGLRARIFGDGPERPALLRAIAGAGLQDAVEAPGFVDREVVDEALGRALCMVLPSRREGYGLIVVEAISRGTPCVLVRDPDNAATELIEEGVNGFIAESAEPAALAAAIERVHAAGPALRASTAGWYSRHARRLSLERSLERVAAAYPAA
jgi:glycosyltransferase involved in cell wall biosynthesis